MRAYTGELWICEGGEIRPTSSLRLAQASLSEGAYAVHNRKATKTPNISRPRVVRIAPPMGAVGAWLGDAQQGGITDVATYHPQ